MKKSFVLGMLGLAAITASSFGAGYILLDNYDSNLNPPITYGIDIPANGVSGPLGTPGTGLLAGWTVGIYYANGNVLSQVAPDPTGSAIPTTLYPGFVLGTGPGSTALIYTSVLNLVPGEFLSPNTLNVGGNAGDLITAEVVAYDTADGSYAAARYRAHSAPFTMPTLSVISPPTINLVGDYMPAFSVGVPEPSMVALGGLAGLSLWLLRRKKD